MRRRALLFALVSVMALGALPVLAQDAPPDIEIVDINTTRYRDDGRTTMVVQFQNFESIDPSEVVVLEDGVVVPDVEVTTIEESAVDVGVVLLIDTSGSMRQNDALVAAQDAARTFITEKRPQDFISLITFDDEVTLLAPFTENSAVLLPRIENLEARGDTALYDAIIEASSLYRRGRSADFQPNIILLTDGADDGSQGSLETALAAAEEVGARVFAIGIETPAFDPDPLRQIVGATDGLFLTTPEPSQLSGLYSDIKREIDNKLVLRFNARQSLTTDVEFRVRYQGFQSTSATAVPGFVIREAVTTTTVTFAPAATRTIETNLPLPIGTLALLGVGAVAIAVIALVFLLFVPAGDPAAEQFGGRLRAYGGDRGGPEEKKSFLERIPILNRFSQRAEAAAERRGFLAALNATLEQANIPLSGGEALVGGVIASVLVGLVVGALTRSVIPGAVALVISLLVLAFGVQVIGNRERRRFEDQLPDTLSLLATSLRAGYSLLQAIEAVAEETSDPTRREFGRAIAEIRLGRQVVDALEGIAQRTQSEDFAWSVMAIEIQREVGGNLAEVLTTVADTMLQRNRLRRDVRALTAEGRISAIILGSLPFALAGYLLLTNPDYLTVLFEDVVGIIAIVIGSVLMISGIIWLNKIVDIEI